MSKRRHAQCNHDGQKLSAHDQQQIAIFEKYLVRVNEMVTGGMTRQKAEVAAHKEIYPEKK